MLITYAVVSHEMLNSADVLSGLLPFFEPLLMEQDGKIFDQSKLMRDIEANTHWHLTTDIVDQIVQRMVRAHWLTRDRSTQEKIIYTVTLPEGERRLDRSQAVEGLDRVILQFQSFLKTLPIRTSIAANSEELKELLLQWLVDSVADMEVSNPSQTGPTPDAEVKRKSALKIPDTANYLFARFTVWLNSENPPVAKLLTEIAGAVILTEVILHFRNPPALGRRRLGLQVFIDGPIIMDYLGLSGPVAKESAAYTIDKLRELGCGIACFTHSRDEVKEILSSVLKEPSGRTGQRTVDAINRGDISIGDVTATFSVLERKLKDAGVEIVMTALGTLSNVKEFFPDELVTKTGQRLGLQRPDEHGPARVSVRDERDSRSVALVMRKRQGYRTSDLFESKVVMLSQNYRLCRIARETCRDNELLSQWDIGPIVHRSDAAGALFLVVGATDRENITRTELLGTCMDVMRLRPKIVEDVKKQLANLKTRMTVEQLDAALTDPHCAVALMDATIGVNRVVDRSNVEEVVEVLCEALIAEHTEKTKELLELQSSEANAVLSGVISEADAERRRLIEQIKQQMLAEQRARTELEDANRILEGSLRSLTSIHVASLKRMQLFYRVGLVLILIAGVALCVFLASSHWSVLFETATGIGTLIVECFALLGLRVRGYIDKRLTELERRRFNRALVSSSLLEVSKYFDIDLVEGRIASIPGANRFSAS